MYWYHFTNCTAAPVGFLASIISVYTNTDKLTRVADFRITYLCLTGQLDELGPTWCLHWCVLKVYLTNPFSIWNLIDVIKGVFLSFEWITVNIINAVNHKYNDRPSWSNLEICNSVFNFFFILNHKSVFPCTQKCMRDKGFPVTWT